MEDLASRHHEGASGMSVKAALNASAKPFISQAVATVHAQVFCLSVKMPLGSSMWCCTSSPEVEQVHLAAQSQAVDTTLIDDAMRIVMQQLPDTTAVCPYPLVCRSAATQRALRIVNHNASKRSRSLPFTLETTEVSIWLDSACQACFTLDNVW
jgi:hypothetical protein